jgi:hypothetical protein
MVRVVERHAVGADGLPSTWQAAAWLLERRDRKNWGRKVSAEQKEEKPAMSWADLMRIANEA